MLILTLAALVPPFYLMRYIYRQDKVEKEPTKLVGKTVLFGVLSVIPTVVVESFLLNYFYSLYSSMGILGLFLENLIGVALVEEFFKMQAFKLAVWKSPEFNYTFDGVVYSVAAAIGFAACENIMYVFNGGLVTAAARALTAIPGHTIFGIFMGMHMGIAKYAEVNGNPELASREKWLALIIPVILHGCYDFIVSTGSELGIIIFIVGLIVLDIVAIRKIKQFEAEDTYIF